MADIVAVEVECIVDIVIGWRWESGFDASMFQLQLCIKQSFLNLNIAHKRKNVTLVIDDTSSIMDI